MARWLGGPYDERYGASALGGGVDGVLSEYVVLDHEALVSLPHHLTFVEGATLPCAGVTAWNALFGGPRPLLPGEEVLIEGTGGVSLFALAFARMAGARAIVTTTSASKRDRALELGADIVVVLPETEDWPARVREVTGGRGVDHVVEVVGGANVAAAAQAARNGGQIHLIGAQASGAVDPVQLRRRNILLRGIYVGSRTEFEAMNRAIARTRYRPVVDRVFPFEAAGEAYAHLRAQKHLGKVVIQIGGAEPGRG
jgi:NADPH:quinone reductase-like Zn-dependent oxidoreductase